jgi:hydroxyacylglutathione hydrolase
MVASIPSSSSHQLFAGVFNFKMEIQRVPCKMSNAYMVDTGVGIILIDTGGPGSEKIILRRIKEFNKEEIILIFITHAHLDHYGSAKLVKEYTKAPITIHRADAQSMITGNTKLGRTRGLGKIIQLVLPIIDRLYQPIQVIPDFVLNDGEKLQSWGVDATIIHTPGHTPGSSTLLFSNGTAFVGDLVSSSGRPHTQRYFAYDWALLLESQNKLASYKPKWIYPGHGPHPINGEVFLSIL